MPVAQPQQSTTGVLEIAREFFGELNASGIPYIHWKSNDHLEAGLAGETDLDLFVPRQHRRALRGLLDRFAFRLLSIEDLYRYPAMEDYLGYDRPSGRFLHLHMHYRIILGEWNLKSFHVPVEEYLLEGARPSCGVSVPDPAREAVVLLLRAVAKGMGWRHPRRVAFLVANRLFLHRPLRDEMGELRALLQRCSADELGAALAAFPAPEDVRRALDAGLRGPGPGAAARRVLRRYLRSCSWRGRGEITRVWTRKVVSGPKKKLLLPGAPSVGIVGSDGTGKTTVVKRLREDFSWKVRVHREYLGYNPREMGWATLLLFRLSLPIAAAQKLWPAGPLRWLYVRRELFLERRGYRERMQRYRRGRRRAFAGELVLFERFPLHRTLDNPAFLLDENLLTHDKPFPPRLRALPSVRRRIADLDEKYAAFPRPDLLIVLRNERDYLAERRPWLDERRKSVIYRKRERVERFLAVEEGSPGVRVVSTEQPVDDVLRRIKEAIWEHLPG